MEALVMLSFCIAELGAKYQIDPTTAEERGSPDILQVFRTLVSKYRRIKHIPGGSLPDPLSC